MCLMLLATQGVWQVHKYILDRCPLTAFDFFLDEPRGASSGQPSARAQQAVGRLSCTHVREFTLISLSWGSVLH